MKSLISGVLLFFSATAVAADFRVADFGAKGDGTTLDTVAIQRTIDACARAGGGRVVLDGGTFLSGTLTLRSRVELHLDASATLLGSPNCADYPERTGLRHVDSAALPRARNACLLYAEAATNIALTGRGTIDGNGSRFVRPRRAGEPGWAPFVRIPGLPTPPRVVFFAGCADVTVTDVKLIDPPAGWSYWIHDCDRVRFDRVTILADLRVPNNDGIHINCCRDVFVSNCRVETCDDAIIVRANSRSLRENRSCERVFVSNCSLRSACSCIRLGYLNDGVIRDCRFSNLVLYDSPIGIRMELPKFDAQKADRGREATLIEDIAFSGVSMRNVREPFEFTISPDPGTLCTAVRNIRFTDVIGHHSGKSYFRGRKENPLTDFCFVNCALDSREPPLVEHCQGVAPPR